MDYDCPISWAWSFPANHQPASPRPTSCPAAGRIPAPVKVVGAYLEFRSEGAAALTVGDRATISGNSAGMQRRDHLLMFFIDDSTLDYHLRLTGHPAANLRSPWWKLHAKTAGLWADA